MLKFSSDNDIQRTVRIDLYQLHSVHSILTISQSSASISQGGDPAGAGTVEITPAMNGRNEYPANKEKATYEKQDASYLTD